MTRLGADADALDRLASELDAATARVRSTLAELSSSTSGAAWWGVDAERFRAQWRDDGGPVCRSVVATLDRAAVGCRRQAEEQRGASRVDSGSAVTLGTSGDRSRPTSTTPRRIRVLSVDAEAGADVVAAAGLVYVVEDMADGRARVTERLSAGAGAEAGVEARVAWSTGEHTHSVGADGSIRLLPTIGTEASWVVPSDEVDELVGARVADIALGPGARDAAAGVLGAIPGLGALAAATGLGDGLRRATYRVPEPDRTGLTAGVATDGGGGGTVGSTSWTAAGSVGVGVAVVSEGGRTLVRFGEDVAGRVGVGNGSASADVSSSVGLVLGNDGRPVRLEVVTDRTADDGTLRRTTRTADLTAPGARAVVDRLEHQIAAGEAWSHPGRVAATLEELAAIGVVGGTMHTDVYRPGADLTYGLQLPVGSVHVRSSTLVLDD